jgi:hypothetical protein
MGHHDINGINQKYSPYAKEFSENYLQFGQALPTSKSLPAKLSVHSFIHSFIYLAFQRSTKVDIELIIITISTVQNDS